MRFAPSTRSALLLGVPLVTAIVWAVESLYLPAGTQLNTTMAVAGGALGAVLIGEAWEAFKRLLTRWGGS
jgi:hypothetical protein